MLLKSIPLFLLFGDASVSRTAQLQAEKATQTNMEESECYTGEGFSKQIKESYQPRHNKEFLP